MKRSCAPSWPIGSRGGRSRRDATVSPAASQHNTHDRRIDRGHFQTLQLHAAHPAAALIPQRLRLARVSAADHRREMYDAVSVFALNRVQDTLGLGVDGAFFVEFAERSLRRGLVTLAFAAGKFPLTGEMRVVLPLRDKPPVVAVNQCDGNLLRGLRHYSPIVRDRVNRRVLE
jgi:hypothetical protein